MPQTTAPQPEEQTFSNDAHEVVRGLRVAFSELLMSIGADPSTPGSISEHLGLNKNLAWKLTKIIGAEDPAAALEQMPGPPGIRILLKGIEKTKAEPPLVQTARDAISDYERLIEVHTGDRATLDMMGSNLATKGRQARDEQHRKLLFQGSSYVWGAQTRTLLKIGMMMPSAREGCVDLANVNSFIDFRRIRPDVSWIMSRRSSSDDANRSGNVYALEALDRSYAQGENVAPLMPAFCSDPIPELRRVKDRDAESYELTEGPAGNTGALTCTAGTMHRELPMYGTPENSWGTHIARCEVPSELMIVDMLFHRDLTFAMDPIVELYSDVAGMTSTHVRTKLHLSEQLMDLGVSRTPPPTPQFARYRAMIDWLMERTGHAYEDFHAFRIKIAYPAFPTALEIKHPLPMREDA
ncbi:MAG: hypothetical protein ACF8LL_00375 [Phycisphaerales bacterium]